MCVLGNSKLPHFRKNCKKQNKKCQFAAYTNWENENAKKYHQFLCFFTPSFTFICRRNSLKLFCFVKPSPPRCKHLLHVIATRCGCMCDGRSWKSETHLLSWEMHMDVNHNTISHTYEIWPSTIHFDSTCWSKMYADVQQYHRSSQTHLVVYITIENNVLSF